MRKLPNCSAAAGLLAHSFDGNAARNRFCSASDVMGFLNSPGSVLPFVVDVVVFVFLAALSALTPPPPLVCSALRDLASMLLVGEEDEASRLLLFSSVGFVLSARLPRPSVTTELESGLSGDLLLLVTSEPDVGGGAWRFVGLEDEREDGCLSRPLVAASFAVGGGDGEAVEVTRGLAAPCWELLSSVELAKLSVWSKSVFAGAGNEMIFVCYFLRGRLLLRIIDDNVSNFFS